MAKFDSTDLFGMVAVVRDSYKQDVQKADKKRRNILEKARKFSNALGMKNAREQADKEYEESVERARFKIRSEFLEDVLPKVRENEIKRVQNINVAKTEKLKMLMDREMTPEEFYAIASDDNVATDYWCSSYLRTIAERSGLCIEDLPEDCHVLPNVSTKLKVLSAIAEETEDMLKNYNPSEDSLRNTAFLHRSHIQRWLGEYTNGLRTLASLPDSMIVERAMNNICQCPDELTRGQAINKELRNVPDRCRAELLSEIVAKNSIGDTAWRLSGFESELKDFKKRGGTAEYKDALYAVDQVLSAKDTMDENALNAIHGMKNNRYFVSELQKSASTDIAKHYCELAEEQAAEGVAD